ncbi:hypothetical protein [Candidatus Nitronereus thalassa]|uniref:Secreted protein n=1 Tax=Candidatus Nitronereus thalassa TaxID=3020898 RepID=A0ABU3K301_9BACT|nr:hypothetical protein [Candidatus Nitronereus thalassa]MDT7040768.1 hypothetical protein [Candidatus Nitronereus thalassa]
MKRNMVGIVLAGVVGLLGPVGCAIDSPREMLNRNDHTVLAAWYKNEADSLRSRAEEMRQMAEWFAVARLQSPPPFLENVNPGQSKLSMVVHCRDLAQAYEAAAEENAALAEAHAEQMVRQ